MADASWVEKAPHQTPPLALDSYPAFALIERMDRVMFPRPLFVGIQLSLLLAHSGHSMPKQSAQIADLHQKIGAHVRFRKQPTFKGSIFERQLPIRASSVPHKESRVYPHALRRITGRVFEEGGTHGRTDVGQDFLPLLSGEFFVRQAGSSVYLFDHDGVSMKIFEGRLKGVWQKFQGLDRFSALQFHDLGLTDVHYTTAFDVPYGLVDEQVATRIGLMNELEFDTRAGARCTFEFTFTHVPASEAGSEPNQHTLEVINVPTGGGIERVLYQLNDIVAPLTQLIATEP